MKLLDFVACEDIRQELGGKLSFMGVFADSITLQIPKGAPRPVGFRLSVFFRVFIEESDPMPDHFRVVVKTGSEQDRIIEGDFSAKDRPRILQLPLPLNAVVVSGDTTLSFQVTFSAGEQLLLDAAPAYGLAVKVVELLDAA